MKKSLFLSLWVTLLTVCLPGALQAQSADDGFEPGANNIVRCLAAQANGQILVGGYFTTLAGQARNYLGRLNADGSLDTTFTNGANGIVESLVVQPDGKILVGGHFTTLAGQPHNYLGRLNADGSLDTTFSNGADYLVECLAMQADGKILAGGYFTNLAGQARSHLGRLNADGSLDTTFTNGADDNVYSLAVQPDGKIVVGGSFTTLADQARSHLGRLNVDGSLDMTFTNGASGSVQSLAVQANGQILVGGNFTNLAGQARANLGRLNADGSLDMTFTNGANDTGVYSLAVQPDGKILVGGWFTTLAGQERSCLGRLEADGSLDITFTNGVGGNVVDSLLVQADGKILVGGWFTTLAGQPRNYLGRFYADGSLDMSLTNGANGRVVSLAVQADGRILVGGIFTTLAGQLHANLGRLNANGLLDTTFLGGANQQVLSLVVQADDKILVGGWFSMLAGQSRGGVGRLNADGSLDATFTNGVNDSVFVLALQTDGKILVGGRFTTLAGQPRQNLGRLNADGSLDTTFTNGVNYIGGYPVESLAVQADGKILVGGTFTTLAGQPRQNLGRLNADGSLDTTFTNGANHVVESLAVQADGKILVGGSFTTLAGRPRSYLGRLNADSSLDTTFTNGANNRVVSLAIQTDGKILAGGLFTTLAGQSRSRLGRLNADGSLDPTFTSEANNEVCGLAIQADGKILVGGIFTILAGQPRSYLGRLSTADAATQNLRATMNSVTWERGGTGPEVWRTTFEQSSNGVDWIDLGAGTRVTGGWQVTNLTLPIGMNFFVRAQGFARYGQWNGSESILESVRLVYFNGLVLYFPFSANANDQSGMGNNGVVHGATLTSDRFGAPERAYQFDGIDDYIDCGQPPSLDFTGPFTIAAWINPLDLEGYGSKYRTIVGKWKDWNPGDVDLRQYTFGFGHGGYVHLGIGAGGPWDAVMSAEPLTTGVWTHIAGVYDGSSLKVYINGVEQGSKSTSLAMVSQPVPVQLGAANCGGWGQEFFQGKMSDVRMYNRALASNEIWALGPSLPNDFCSGAMALSDNIYYSENTATAADDVTPGRGTIAKGVWFTYTPSVSGMTTVDTCTSDFDTVLEVMSGSCGSLTPIANNDDGSCDIQSSVSFVCSAGVTYLICAGGCDGASGSLKIRVHNDGIVNLALASDGSTISGTADGVNLENLIDGVTASYDGENGYGYTVWTPTPGAIMLDLKKLCTISSMRLLLWDLDNRYYRYKIEASRDHLTWDTIVDRTAETDQCRSWQDIGFNPPIQARYLRLMGTYNSANVQFHVVEWEVYGVPPETFRSMADDGFNPGAQSGVNCLSVQTNGQILVGGSFTNLAGQARSRLGRLNADGSLDPTFTNGANNSVYSLSIQTNGQILVGGSFTNLAGQACGGLGRLNADGSLDTTFTNGTDYLVNSLAVQTDGKILVGGIFTTLAGQPRANLGRLNADGSLDTTFTNDADYVVSFLAVQPDGKILVCGHFTTLAGQPRSHLGRLNADGSLDTTFTNGADNLVYSLAIQADGKILVGGLFTTLAGQPRANLGRLNADGSLDTTFTNGVNDYGVFSLAVQADGKILVGGLFTMLANQPRNYLGRLNVDGSLDTTFTNGAGYFVESLVEQPDGKILVGGSFTTLASQPRMYLGRLYADGSLDATLVNGVNDIGGYPVKSLAVQADGKILVGGAFTELAGQPHMHLGRLYPDGSLDPIFTNGVSAHGGVNSLAVQADGKILIGGAFTTLAGQPRNYLGRLNEDGSLDGTFTNGANGMVVTLAVQMDGKILVGGMFTTLAGQPRMHLGRLYPDGSLDPTFTNGVSVNGNVFCLAAQADGKILVGGEFDTLAGQACYRLGRLNVDGSLDPTFNSGANSTVVTLAVQADGKILVGGAFIELAGQARSRLGRLNVDGSLDPTFNSGANFIVESLAIQADGKILVGGEFTMLAGQPCRLGRLNANGSLDPTFPNEISVNGSVISVALQEDGKILVGGNFTTLDGQARARLGRLSTGSAANQNLLVTTNGVVWERSGAGPEVWRTTFEQSSNGIDWLSLGAGTRVTDGWQVTNLALPFGTNFYVRARGFARGGLYNASESILESVRLVYFNTLTTNGLSNDLCSGAIALSDNIYYSENTATATDDVTPGRGTIAKGVWFTYTPSVSGTMTVDTCRSDFDTVLEVMSGSCGSLTPIANNDDGSCDIQSSVSFVCSRGMTYLICAGGCDGASGSLKIRVHNDGIVNLALASGGSTISGTADGVNLENLIDGVTTGYDGENGYGYTLWTPTPGAITLDLKKLCTISSMKLLLWDLDRRYYRYKIEASSDHLTWDTIVDRTAETNRRRSWQNIGFNPPIQARYLRLMGTYNSANVQFHVVEWEVYGVTISDNETPRILTVSMRNWDGSTPSNISTLGRVLRYTSGGQVIDTNYPNISGDVYYDLNQVSVGESYYFDAYYYDADPFESGDELWASSNVTVAAGLNTLTLTRSFPYADDVRVRNESVVFTDEFENDLSAWTKLFGVQNEWWVENGELRGNYDISCGSVGCRQTDLILKHAYQLSDHWRASIFFKRNQTIGYNHYSAAGCFSIWLPDSGNRRLFFDIGGAGFNNWGGLQTNFSVDIQYWNGSAWSGISLNRYNFLWDPDEWHKAALEKHGNVYTISMDDMVTQVYTDTVMNGAGEVGFHAYGTHRYDHFMLTSLDTPSDNEMGEGVPLSSSLIYYARVNNKGSVDQTARVAFRSDRDQTPPYDYDQVSEARRILANGGMTTFAMPPHIPSEQGTYHSALEVQTWIDGEWVKTDSWTGGVVNVIDNDDSNGDRNLALASGGSTISGTADGVNLESLIDGVTTDYDGENGYGYTLWTPTPGAITLDLKMLCTISSMKLLLWDLDDRYYRYKIEASSDQLMWDTIVDRTAEMDQCRSWQDIGFNPPIQARYLRLTGTYNSANVQFHVVEWEVY